jgi:hypothetical protein
MFTASPVGESSNPSSKVHQVFFFECALTTVAVFIPTSQPKNGVRNKSFENSNYRFPKSQLGAESRQRTPLELAKASVGAEY